MHRHLPAQQITSATLESDRAQITILSLGAITQSWRVADGRNVVLGYNDPQQYEHNPNYLGAIAGRVANRIPGGHFRLGGQDIYLPCNLAHDHLHGGPDGLSKCNWMLEKDSAANAVQLSYCSPHGESGYPGAVEFSVTITLENATLSYEMRANVDRPTPISLAQHNYYNLGGPAPDTALWLDAADYLPTDAAKITHGNRATVAGTPYDFQRARLLPAEDLDAHMILRGAPLAAEAKSHGLRLRMRTDQPGLQLYAGAHLADGFAPHQGFCLEAQQPPNAVNTDPQRVIATPDRPYFQRTEVEIIAC